MFAIPTETITAQKLMMQGGEGELVIMQLTDGRGAIVAGDARGLVVSLIVGEVEQGKTALDIRRDDHIESLGGAKLTDIAGFSKLYEAIPIGGTVAIGTRRGDHTMQLQFKKPEPPTRQRMMMMADDSGSAAAAAPGVAPKGWVTNDAKDSDEFSIAGATIRQQTDGPSVTYRGSHPAAATVRLVVGDKIVSINGKPVANLTTLRDEYDALADGTTVVLMVTRRGVSTSVRFTKVAK